MKSTSPAKHSSSAAAKREKVNLHATWPNKKTGESTTAKVNPKISKD